MSLGKIIGEFKGPQPLNEASVYRTLIEEGLFVEQEVFPRVPLIPGDKSTYLHVSSLPYTCARQDALRIVHRLVVQKVETPENTYTFAVGNAHHEAFQSRILPMLVRDRLRGWWSGENGDLLQADNSDPDFERAVLFSSPDATAEYREPSFRSPTLGISGRMDAIIDWTGSGRKGVPDDLEVQELKSHALERWAGIDPAQGGFPKEDHVEQVKVYLLLSGIRHGRIVYIKKGVSKLDDCLVEWTVTPFLGHEVAMFKSRLARYWKEIREAHTEKKVPVDRICQSSSCWKAKGCPVRHECFHMTPKAPRPYLRKMTDEEEAAWAKRIVL